MISELLLTATIKFPKPYGYVTFNIHFIIFNILAIVVINIIVEITIIMVKIILYYEFIAVITDPCR